MHAVFRIIAVTALSLSTLGSLPSFADDIEKCRQFTHQFADKMVAANKIKLAQIDKLAEQLRVQYNQNNGANEDFNTIITALKQDEVFQSVVNINMKLLPQAFRNITQNEKDRVLCDDYDKIEDSAEQAQEKLDAVIEQMTLKINDRFELETLEADEGLVLIAAYADGYAESVQLKSEKLFGDGITIGPLDKTQYFKIIKLKKGYYYWDRVKERLSYGRSRYFDFSEDKLGFEVIPGKINLTGVFLFERYNNRANADIADRSAITLTIMQQRYPILSQAYQWVNALAPQDPYLDFYRQEKANHE